ncbi:selenocysteine-specific translation elongation factor [Phytoactinopolyspora limicola]|uniref:selenocysteine-specific translation elongation factor n=1 Tax=Phytoactinopolyspora limicola TaxID=2715536 RepID=UPI00140B1C95|nr:selenocysteine-specific translation elongation factor [Phytoactinopolyspora limicola]
MHVIATAGHVDHGKSTVVRELTGTDPDRWAEEKDRGLTIDLGFAWATLPSGTEVAFVDVPGHERFVTNMLAGVGPVPAVLFVVAADGGWMPQSEEHLAAIDALEIRHGVVAVTRCDLADPGAVVTDTQRRLAGTSLAGAALVEVSAARGLGMDRLRGELEAMVRTLPAPATDAPVRLWIDRSFVIRGAGTVVTGTLTQGTLRVGDQLAINGSGPIVRVRSLQTLKRQVMSVSGVARVAVNLRRVPREDVRRGDALVGDGPWRPTAEIDVRATSQLPARAPGHATVHFGSAAVPARVRILAPHIVRLTLGRPLPLAEGDVGLLRRPDEHAILTGLLVLDACPPPLAGRGAARSRAEEIEEHSAGRRWRAELRRRQFIHESEVDRPRLDPAVETITGGWYVDADVWEALPARLEAAASEWLRQRPLEAGVPVRAACRMLDVPSPAIVEAAARRTSLIVAGGRIDSPGRVALPDHVLDAISTLAVGWADHPFHAPKARELDELGIGTHEIAAAARAGRLLVVTRGVVLPPDAEDAAVRVLARLPAPFTLSAARQALDTTRRVAVPLLEHLDRRRRTIRLTPELRKLADVDG